jgi:hypothetical protein
MNTEPSDELISAALDGEPVDVDALQRALQRPEARDTLAAFVLLRAATADDAHRAADASPGSRTRAGAGQPTFAPRTRWNRLPLAVAASLAALAMAGSFWLGATWRLESAGGRQSGQENAPALTVPADDPAARPGRTAADEPPTPTRHEKFVRGVDWHSGS